MAEDYISQFYDWSTSDVITAARLDGNITNITNGLSGGSKAINVGKILMNGTTTIDSSRNATLADTTSTKLTMSGDIIYDLDAGLTAGTTQTQAGGLALTAAWNEVSTVANAKDTVVLPTAVAGKSVTVINNGANLMQIFPAVSDDLGTGVDTADYIAVGEIVEFVAYDTTTWVARRTPTPWTSYTPTTQGFGSISSSNMEWRKNGDCIEVRGEFQTGTVAASEAQVGLPSGWDVVANSAVAPEVVGMAASNASNNVLFVALATNGDAYVNFGKLDITTATSKVSVINGNAGFNSNTTTQFNFSVKVTAT
jgi:hypothetical protein